jgi:magnesium transporter
MIHRYVCKESGQLWLDIVNPSKEELIAIAAEFRLHPTSVQDCLDPEHLPKHEKIEGSQFIILRAYDSEATRDADTVEELTRKVAFFYSETLLITVHRVDQAFMIRERERWVERVDGTSDAIHTIFKDIVKDVIFSYTQPIDRGLDDFEQLEMSVFGTQSAKEFKIENAYYLKRRASVFKRMIKASMDILPRIESPYRGTPHFQNLQDEGVSLLFFADELTESVNSLLNLHVSLSSQRTNEASHKTNEVMRVLTIFSVFMLPLNVFTGIYGMNFEHMPELGWTLGYPMVIAAMITTEVLIFLWFKSKGWLHRTAK